MLRGRAALGSGGIGGIGEKRIMTKSELIELIATKQTQLSVKDVELAVKTIIEQMSETLSAGNRIEIRGFGSFTSVPHQARIGRNPQTGAAIKIKAKNVVKFKAGKKLQDLI